MNQFKGQATKRLSLIDSTFLSLETRDTPMHIACLQIYALPVGAPPDFVKRIVKRFRNPSVLASPFNLQLTAAPMSRLLPAMSVAKNIDLDYHVRHSALPDPGGERELGELVSHLHSQLLDRTRPLWTCHVIEGLYDNRFAIYIKLHHALADGISATRMMARALATEPDGAWRPLWEQAQSGAEPKSNHSSDETPKLQSKLAPSEWPRVMAQAFRPMVLRENDVEPVLRPFEAPRSVLNGRVTNARRVATQQLDLQRVKRLAKQTGGSLNDVFLAVCSAALRRHLLSQGALPQKSLIAGVPVSLREAGDDTSSNAVGYLWAALGTEIVDPLERIAVIRASMEASKNHLKSLPPQARKIFTQLTVMPSALAMMSGFGAKFRPPMNLTISNVPGPEKTLYLNGAPMLANYPISIPAQGQALNITCVSYAGQLNIGFTGSRDSLPHLQKMAVYAGEALDELEVLLATRSKH
ncbi:MAG: WS/DGAT/MGAT family O-acyltransferase [Stenotrophobium sp.]